MKRGETGGRSAPGKAGLVRPSLRFRDSFLEATQEFPLDEDTMVFEREQATRDFNGFVKSVDAYARGENLPRGWVASSSFWLVDGDEYIGSTNIRHDLTEWLERYGGHIGYAIRPTKRQQGYGKLICKLALEEAREIGLTRVLITCDADNVASRKVIEANGGVFENEVPQPDRSAPKRRYWFDL
jgi:predicted acetyltransferase